MRLTHRIEYTVVLSEEEVNYLDKWDKAWRDKPPARVAHELNVDQFSMGWPKLREWELEE